MDNVNTIVPTIQETQKSQQEVNSQDKIEKTEKNSIDTGTEQIKSDEVYSVSQIKTAKDDDGSDKKNISPTTGSKNKDLHVVDLTGEVDKLKPVNNQADPETKLFDEEEDEFIEDVEAAHGHK